MSNKKTKEVLDIDTVAKEINDLDKNIILIYGFNGTGKTRLSVAYKDLTKANNDGNHAGVYYNAYSEDLFYWDNDEENNGENLRLIIQKSTLNKYHASFSEKDLREKISPYNPKYDFDFKFYSNVAQGIESIKFFLKTESGATKSTETIKISRGEERTFVWCFFLALFEMEDWAGQQSKHLFIDDPVSSLDDHNIFITAFLLMNLIDSYFENRKIIITTHHVGFYAILSDWLTKGEKSSLYEKHTQMEILKRVGDNIHLLNHKKDVFLYHLELLQILKNAVDRKELYAYHFALLRQILENIASFLGTRRISFVLEEIDIKNKDYIAKVINILTHKNIFRYEAKEMVDDNVKIFKDIFNKLMKKYKFIVHEKKS